MDGTSLDLVFIDGDHSYEAVRADWKGGEVRSAKRALAFHDAISAQAIPKAPFRFVDRDFPEDLPGGLADRRGGRHSRGRCPHVRVAKTLSSVIPVRLCGGEGHGRLATPSNANHCASRQSEADRSPAGPTASPGIAPNASVSVQMLRVGRLMIRRG